MQQIKTKVLIIQNILLNYRIPVYNELANRNGIELTIAHSKKSDNYEDIKFKIKYIEITRKGMFLFHKENLFRIAQNFDIVIGMPDPHWLSILSLAFYKKRKYKLIFWGIGVTASYTKGFDSGGLGDKIRKIIFKKSDALLFYSNYPKKKYTALGWPENKIFVANNTTKVLNSIFVPSQKNNIIFIGTLYKQKRIYDLLESYLMASKKTKIHNNLIIIGDGPEKANVLSWIKMNHLEKKIILRGAIYDERIVCEEFENSIACISPGQAGLSVLKSFGYGVPFITRKDAITGGEIFNVNNMKNGILYDNNMDLTGILIDISKNKEKYIEMGKNALTYYYKKRRIDQMVDGFVESINFLNNI